MALFFAVIGTLLYWSDSSSPARVQNETLFRFMMALYTHA
jgi:hypothetical protein